MKVAVLLGFSTTGKSTLKGHFAADQEAGYIDICDTDVMIAEPYDGHIYNLFLRLVSGKDRDAALRAVEDAENDFLDRFRPTKPTLVVAGPNLVVRSKWPSFVANVKPECFYLTITAEEVYEGLLYRRRKQEVIVGVGDHKAFGSWDEGATTAYDEKTSRWVLLDRQAAIDRIEANMKRQVSEYLKRSDPENRFVGGHALRGNESAQQTVIEKIRAYLEIH